MNAIEPRTKIQPPPSSLARCVLDSLALASVSVSMRRATSWRTSRFKAIPISRVFAGPVFPFLPWLTGANYPIAENRSCLQPVSGHSLWSRKHYSREPHICSRIRPRIEKEFLRFTLAPRSSTVSLVSAAWGRPNEIREPSATALARMKSPSVRSSWLSAYSIAIVTTVIHRVGRPGSPDRQN